MPRMRAYLGMLILVLMLGAGVAQAQPAAGQAPRTKAEHSLVTHLWSWLSSVLGKATSLVDPDSGSSTKLPAAQPDFGSFIDPNGNH